jgi:hypothetical protein
MEKILTRLKEAQRLMPKAMPRSKSGAMLLLLLVWKWLSDAWQQQAAATAGIPDAAPDASHYAALDGEFAPFVPILFQPTTLFHACHWTEPRQAGTAIRASLYALMALQPKPFLNDILLPERFGYRGEFADHLFATPALTNVMTLIGELPYNPALPLGQLVEHAMLHLGLRHDGTPPRLARLMAQLVQPFPHETVLDPVCGRGDLLMACVAQLEQATQTSPLPPSAGLHLYGQDDDPDLIAVAKLRLLAHGFAPEQLSNRHYLKHPLTTPPLGALQQADIVLSTIAPAPDEWHGLDENTEFMHRFANDVPTRAQLAQVWHALACARPHNARIVLLIDKTELSDSAAQPLIQYLLRNWLAAVIDVPPTLCPQTMPDALLLVLHKQSQRRHVTFVRAGQTPPEYDAKAILGAWFAIQSRQPNPHAVAIPHASIAQQQYSLDWQQFPAARAGSPDCATLTGAA